MPKRELEPDDGERTIDQTELFFGYLSRLVDQAVQLKAHAKAKAEQKKRKKERSPSMRERSSSVAVGADVEGARGAHRRHQSESEQDRPSETRPRVTERCRDSSHRGGAVDGGACRRRDGEGARRCRCGPWNRH